MKAATIFKFRKLALIRPLLSYTRIANFCQNIDKSKMTDEELIKKRIFKDDKQEEKFIKLVKSNAIDLTQNKTPPGIKSSFIILYGPITVMALKLAFSQFTSPVDFWLTARACLRILSLNLAFMGGIHYGIGGALYEISTLRYLQKEAGRQVMYSFIPGIAAFGIVTWMLNVNPLTVGTLISGFALLNLINILSMFVDIHYIRSEKLPFWYISTRRLSCVYLIVISMIIFAAMFTKLDYVQK